MRELSDICHHSAVADWRSLIKVIFDWVAASTGAERTRRIEEVREVVRLVRVQADLLAKLNPRKEQGRIEQARQQIHDLLRSLVEKLGTAKQSP